MASTFGDTEADREEKEAAQRRIVKPAKTLIDESGFGYEEGAIYSRKKAAPELGEPDAWLVPWCRANGDAGTNVYVKEGDARNAAKNLEVYSRSETTADVIPLYAARGRQSPVSEGQWADIALAFEKCAEVAEMWAKQEPGDPATDNEWSRGNRYGQGQAGAQIASAIRRMANAAKPRPVSSTERK